MRTLLYWQAMGWTEWWRWAAALALMLALVVLLAGRAEAAGLVSAEPSADEIVGEAPHVVILTFDEPLALERGAHDVIVEDSEGRRIDAEDTRIAAYSDSTLIVSLEVAEGALHVAWQVAFRGADAPTTGELTFTVKPGAIPLAEDVEIAAEPRSSESIVLWTVGIVSAVAVFVMFLYFFRFATGNARSSVDGVDDAPH